MRYSNNEETILTGLIDTDKEVTIKIIDLDLDKEVPLFDNKCKKSSIIPYLYTFSTSNINKKDFTNRLYNLFFIMQSEDGKIAYGKFTIGGDIHNKVQKLLDIELGNWKIHNNTMYIMDKNNNLIAKFNLFDRFGMPSETQVYERKYSE